jgi:hypothetical protein
MKTNSSFHPAGAALLTGVISLLAAGTLNAQPGIDPAIGMPGAAPAPGTHVDPATGLIPAPNAPTPPPDPTGVQAAISTATSVQQQIAAGQYDDALQNCLTFYHQLQGNQSLNPLVDQWVELGRRYPKAREELVRIRDAKAGEFSKGGYAVLFSEVKAINEGLNQDDATVTLFKAMLKRDRRLAGQCYPYVEDLLMQKGEYALCLDCLGDPLKQFESLRRGLAMQQQMDERQKQWQADLAERQTEQRAQLEEVAKKNHQPMPPVFHSPFQPVDMGEMATNNFVGQVRKLVEILVATGDQATAGQIREAALTVTDDGRLKSAVEDAEHKLHKSN